MRRLDDDSLLLSPGDLTAHLACPRLTVLNRDVARGALKRPFRGEDPHLELIREHGFAHEAAYLDDLRGRYGVDAVVVIAEPDRRRLASVMESVEATRAAMREGASVVFQAAFLEDGWHGYADFLLRVDRPSALGDFSYEVLDTKLARSIKPPHVHQLTRYSLHVQQIQGVLPDAAHVVLGIGEIQSFDVDHVLALHRHGAARLRTALADDVSAFEPDPLDHCGLCDFQRDCRRILRERDDLSFVATLGRDQRAKLTDVGVETLAVLAQMAPDAERGKLSDVTFTRVRVQAELQKRTRDTGELQRRHLPAERARGYARLPEPSPGDVFFDLEGDPFAGPEGIEYLWGYELLGPTGEPEYHVLWAHDESRERAALERFVDFVVARRHAHPGLHVFHYAPHEVSTLRRLAAKYSTREAEVDQLLRDGILVDLYAVVRQAVQVGQESYSIKKLEPFYMGERQSTIREGGGSIVAYEKWIEAQDQSILAEIALYNREDCTSTRLLRDWLLELREEAAVEQGVDFEALRDPEPEDELTDPGWVPAMRALQDELEARLPADPAEDDVDQAERRRLGSLLFYHRRESKPQWWRFFELCDMTDAELEDQPDAIAGLQADHTEAPIAVKRSTQTWLAFPAQEHRLGIGDVIDPPTGDGAGTIVQIEAARLLLHRGPRFDGKGLPTALIGPSPLDSKQQRGALIRVAEDLRDGTGNYPPVAALLRRELPTLAGVTPGAPLVAGHVTEQEAVHVMLALRDTCLAVQGPPGAGKTHTGARMIVAALDAGQRVAVSATNHKAIHNLVAEVEKVAHARGVALRGMHKHSGPDSEYSSALGLVDSSADNAHLTDRALNLVSGTPWLFSRADHDRAFDLLVIDEAGQMSLADAVAVGTAAKSFVLLGDQQQLPHVSQGTHPDGASASVLQHVLAGDATIAPERGLFLDTSWRMHPEICAFVSERFYDRRLESVAGCAQQRITASGPLHGAGLRLLEVDHDGRSQYAPEEAAAIAQACADMLAGGTATLREDSTRDLLPEDIMVVAPYNLAVREIAAAVPAGVRVGTVDRFQGQEAPVVFYAMTSSTGADAPRGLDFLFQPNRLNVAVSRAQCLTILVCSPRLMQAECRTLEQMRMVNHVCRYAEMASTVRPADLAATTA